MYGHKHAIAMPYNTKKPTEIRLVFLALFGLLTACRENNYLNLAGDRSEPSQPSDSRALTERARSERETSRWIIRAAWLHLLPGVRRRSIYQVVCLGSSAAVQLLGKLISGAASRLDAVSAYPSWT